MLIDTHAHLDQLSDCPAALKRAYDAGVTGVIAVSEGLLHSQRNLEIARASTLSKIYLACGIHPSEAHKEDLNAMKEFIRDHRPDITAIGEIGLDFWYRWARKDEEIKSRQRQVFRELLAEALKYDLPVSIHSRGAWDDCFTIVKELGIRRAVFHWYSGPLDILDKILAEDYLISVTPSLAYSVEAQLAAQHAPVKQILIETDSPVFYRLPENKDEGFSAEPKDVSKTLELYCGLKKCDIQSTAEILNNNAIKFFKLS
ncbi:MAG: TatD family hydrolase [Candidatus Omnitrophica bacterium]|nr:TatD family hydrolase [Candidatus Omnitrophota bacterium]